MVKCITGILYSAFYKLCTLLPNLMQLNHIPEASEDRLKVGTNINLYLHLSYDHSGSYRGEKVWLCLQDT